MNTTNLDSKRLQKVITDHSEHFHVARNENLAQMIQQFINGLTVRTNDMKDTVLGLFIANHTLGRQVGEKLEALKTPNETAGYLLADGMFQENNINVHVENVLRSLHGTEKFTSLYRKNEFYHGVNRFLRSDMVIEEGYHMIFSYIDKSGVGKHALVDVIADAKVDDLLNSVFFGFLMEKPENESEKNELIEHLFNYSNADLLTVEQAEAVKKENKNLTVFTSLEVVMKHYEDYLAKINIQ